MAEDAEPELVRIDKLLVEPNNCPLEESLSLSMDFVALVPLLDAHWEVRVRSLHIGATCFYVDPVR